MPLFNETNITNLSSAVTHANNVTNGVIGLGTPISVALIIIIIGIIQKGRPSTIFTTAFIIFTILSSLFAWGGWLNPVVAIIGAVISGLGVIWMRIDKNST
jgi:hypothetical protein